MGSLVFYQKLAKMLVERQKESFIYNQESKKAKKQLF